MYKRKLKYIILILFLLLIWTVNKSLACSVAANFNVDDSYPVVNQEVIFTDVSTASGSLLGSNNSVNSWNWSFGNNANPGTGSTQGPYTVSYSEAGDKTVSLTVTGNLGGNDAKTVLIHVGLPPTAGAIGAAQTICNGSTPVALTSTTNGTGSGTLSYEWQTNASGSYVTIPGATSSGYQPPALTATTSYQRRTVTVYGEKTRYSAYTTPVTITVRNNFTAGTIQSTGQTICYGGTPSQIGSATAASGGDGNITYQWRSSADGYTSPISGAASASYTPPAGLTTTTSYRRYANDGACNTTPTLSSGTWTVTVNPLLSAPTTTGGQVCIGSSATLSASGAVSGQVYKWYSAASGGTLLKTSSSYTDNTYTTPVLSATTSYWVSIQNASGCESTRTQVTATFPAPSNDSQTTSGNNTWIGHVYKRSDNQAQAPSDANAFASYYGTITEPETFDESFTGGTVCLPLVSSNSARSIYTEYFATRFRMTSTKTAGIYIADIGSDDGVRLYIDGSLVYNQWVQRSYGTDTKILFQLTGSSNLLLEYYESAADNRVSFQNITKVPNNLTSGTNQTICANNAGSQISANNSLTDSPISGTSGFTVSYQWQQAINSSGPWTDISSATTQNYTPAGLSAGTYYFRRELTVTKTNAGMSSATTVIDFSDIATVTVNATSLAPSVSSNSPVCHNSIIQLSTPIVADATYSWTGPSGFSSNLREPTVVANYYSNQGTYAVTITVNGCTSAAGTTNVVVDLASVGGNIAYVAPVCEGASVTLNLTGNTGNVTRWERRLGTGAWTTITGASATLTDTPPSGGAWEYRAVVKNGSCSEAISSSRTVTVNPMLSITLGTNPVICQNTTTAALSFSSTTGSPAGWVLTFDAAAVAAGFSSTQNGSLGIAPGTISVNVPYGVPAGTYNGSLKVITYSPSCSSVDSPVAITVNASSPASVTIAGNNNVCAGTSITFTATPTNGGISPAYQWKVNGANAGTNASTYTYTPANGDKVTCVLTSNATCATGSQATSNEIAITVNPTQPVSVSIAASANPVCTGTGVTFTATPANGGTTPSYQWKVNGANAGTNASTYTYTPANGDKVTCVLTSNVTCATGNPATSNEINMTVNPLPSATIQGNNSPVCIGDPVIFTLSGTSGAVVTYTINLGSNQSVTLDGGTAIVTVTGAAANQTLTLKSVSNSSCSQTLSGSSTVTANPLPTPGEIHPD